MTSHSADGNLLFGILALQMDFISRDALVTAMHSWVLDKAKPLGQILLDQHAIAGDVRALLDALVEKHLGLHGNDPEQSLAKLSSIGSVRDELKQIADPDLEASLAHVSAAREADPDPYATRSFSVGTPTSSGLRFRILRPHRKGGLGEVSVARDEELDREVALKEIQSRHADDPDSRSRFVLEAKITGGLEHPGIVPVYGLGQYADGRPFYAMRFIAEDNLKEAVEKFHKADLPGRDPSERNSKLRKLLGRFIDVCDAIAYAHSRGVLHRDLKPGNILLGRYGETLVVDWGLAKSGQAAAETTGGSEQPLRVTSPSGSAPTQMGSAIGTPEYMSPEQAGGRLDLLGPASDVYSLGATLYCVLTGNAPFEDRDRGKVLQKVTQGDFAPPRTINRHVSPALNAICLKAMALRPENRYASPRGLADDIEHWLADEPVSAYQASIGEFEKLLKDNPGVPEYLEGLARSHTNLGIVLTGMGRNLDSEVAHRSAIADYELLVKQNPNVPRYFADLVASRFHLGRILAVLGREAEAEEINHAAIAEYQQLIRAGPLERGILASVLLTIAPEAVRQQMIELPEHVTDSRATLEPVSVARVRDAAQEGEEPSSSVPPETGHALHHARYTLTRLHARGGMSSVWVARDGDLNRVVVLKELPPDHDHPGARQRFIREAQLTAQLEHPNIVPVYELARVPQDERPFYTMRFIHGQTLRAAIADYHRSPRDGAADPLAFRRLLSAFVSVCNALSYAHSRGVIHRDPKPENVVLGSFGQVLLVDWGLAKVLNRGTDEADTQEVTITGEARAEDTVIGRVLGTPGYMAPEMAEGRTDLHDVQTDVYILGSTLFEILTGRPPHQGQHAQGQHIDDILHKIIAGETPRAQLVDPSVPDPLGAICAKAMAKSRTDRYAEVSDLAGDVQRWLDDEPVSVYRDSWTQRLARWARRHWAWVQAGFAALVVVLFISVVASFVIVSARKRAEDAQQKEAKARGAEAAGVVALSSEEPYATPARVCHWLCQSLRRIRALHLSRALAHEPGPGPSRSSGQCRPGVNLLEQRKDAEGTETLAAAGARRSSTRGSSTRPNRGSASA